MSREQLGHRKVVFHRQSFDSNSFEVIKRGVSWLISHEIEMPRESFDGVVSGQSADFRSTTAPAVIAPTVAENPAIVPELILVIMKWTVPCPGCSHHNFVGVYRSEEAETPSFRDRIRVVTKSRSNLLRRLMLFFDSRERQEFQLMVGKISGQGRVDVDGDMGRVDNSV